ncbi:MULTISPECIES: hypothetical protein [unclassified Pseudoalteromonas]|jgi:hypothetical protein|uniref:hypothetical protein n=1 Tax=unclassified Pseudoalteromonas TaxID=194690 RepID=UPI001603B6C6|nr:MULTISPECIES: hypothetical protein [unclassified Pseudoalteromonas]MBB1292742.1 hypothetical protein [Pseudoalteromonas sp. SR41-4]MBB1419576.1 hypothetical protein [Pseudoalteromonas sp. SG44-1]
MPISKGSVAIALASAALVISCYGTFFKSVSLPNDKSSTEQSSIIVTNMPLNNDSNELSVTQLHNKIISLQRQVTSLKIKNTSIDQEYNNDDFKELVLAVLTEKEQQEIDEMRESNPLYGFYADLPQDYELRIKSDSDYAKKITTQLREQILDPNATDIDRLAALTQLQMNMYILNKSKIPEYDFAVVDNILELAANSDDEKFKIQAIEVITQAPVLDQRLTERFTSLLQHESNDYIRRLAGQGLISQYYQSQSSEDGNSQQIAQHILSLYQHTSDDNVRSVLDEMIGNESMLAELRKHAEG